MWPSSGLTQAFLTLQKIPPGSIRANENSEYAFASELWEMIRLKLNVLFSFSTLPPFKKIYMYRMGVPLVSFNLFFSVKVIILNTVSYAIPWHKHF